MFTANDSSRRPPAPGSRMQNGKLDLGGPRNDASWFANAAPSRTSGPSFAQTIGGGGGNGQHRPLDPSEFPSLGGGAQQVGPSASAWSGTTLRTRSPEGRVPFGRGIGRRTQDEAPSQSFAPGAEGYRFGSGQTNSTASRTARSPFPDQAQSQEPIGYTGRQQPTSALTTDGASSPPAPAPQQLPLSSSPPSMKRLSEMTDNERYGMAGLAARTNPAHPDYQPLISGFDLSKLGVPVDQNELISSTWGGPFDENGHVIPDFTLPAAYTVTGVPPLPSKMDSMSDETLLCIFYQYPRDVLQMLAAQTLNKREWRWHMKLKTWLKLDDQSAVPPQRLSDKVERGIYLCFDVLTWKRERREITIHFDDLWEVGAAGNGSGLGAVGPAAAAVAVSNGAYMAGAGPSYMGGSSATGPIGAASGFRGGMGGLSGAFGGGA